MASASVASPTTTAASPAAPSASPTNLAIALAAPSAAAALPGALPNAAKTPPPTGATGSREGLRWALLQYQMATARMVFPVALDLPVVEDPTSPSSPTSAEENRPKRRVVSLMDLPGYGGSQADGSRGQGENGANASTGSTLPVCGICFEPFTVRGLVLCCDHLFCLACLRKWAKTRKTCPHCSRTFAEIFESPVSQGPPTPSQELFLKSLAEMGYGPSDIEALKRSGPSLELPDLVFKWLQVYQQQAERQAMREALERKAAQPQPSSSQLSTVVGGVSLARLGFGRGDSIIRNTGRQARRAFEELLDGAMGVDSPSDSTPFWNAVNQLVEWIDGRTVAPKDALEMIKPLFKQQPETQLKALAIVDAFVMNCAIGFAVEFASHKWMERLLKAAQKDAPGPFYSRLLAVLPEWEKRFASDHRCREFTLALAKLRAIAV